MKDRKKIIIILLSLFYSICILIGHSFIMTNSFKWFSKNIIISILLFIISNVVFYFLLTFIFHKLDHYKIKNKKKKSNKILDLLDKHPFLFSMIVILVLWLPYIIAFYPTILSKDPSFQIKQFFNIPNKYSTYVVLLDPNMIITNHHPVIHTLLLGSCLKLGTLIHNDNLGLFIYSLIQISFLSTTLSYTIVFLKKLNLNRYYLLFMILVYGLVPAFPFYAMSPVKDVIFTCFVIHYMILLYQLIKEDIKGNRIILSIVIMIGMILFRNNGIHVFILSFPFLFLLKKELKKLLLIFVIVIGFNTTYNHVILPVFHITPGSIREKLSIPFQQTARVVKEHGDELEENEIEAIDKILGYDTLADRYNPEKSDPVKNEYNRYATKEDLNNYYKVWISEFFKYPMTYIEATINNIYGYFYPMKLNWYIYYKYEDIIVEDGFNYHYNNLKGLRNILSTYGVNFVYIPLIRILVNIGYNVWILIFMSFYYIYKKKYKMLIVLSPSLISLPVCIASPVNAYFRYTLPFVFGLLLNIGLFIKEGVKENE